MASLLEGDREVRARDWKAKYCGSHSELGAEVRASFPDSSLFTSESYFQTPATTH